MAAVTLAIAQIADHRAQGLAEKVDNIRE